MTVVREPIADGSDRSLPLQSSTETTIRPLSDRLRIAGRMMPFISVMQSFSGRVDSGSVKFDRPIGDSFEGTNYGRLTSRSAVRRAKKTIVMFLR